VTSVPSRTRLVAVAAAVSAIHGSTTSTGPARTRRGGPRGRSRPSRRPRRPGPSGPRAAASTPTPKFGRLSP
jgi:hypothetical protein